MWYPQAPPNYERLTIGLRKPLRASQPSRSPDRSNSNMVTRRRHLASRSEVESVVERARKSNGIAILSGRDLAGLDLSGLDFTGPVFDGLFNTRMLGVDCRHTSLRNCNLQGVDLASANLRGSDLSGA